MNEHQQIDPERDSIHLPSDRSTSPNNGTNNSWSESPRLRFLLEAIAAVPSPVPWIVAPIRSLWLIVLCHDSDEASTLILEAVGGELSSAFERETSRDGRDRVVAAIAENL